MYLAVALQKQMMREGLISPIAITEQIRNHYGLHPYLFRIGSVIAKTKPELAMTKAELAMTKAELAINQFNYLFQFVVPAEAGIQPLY